MWPDTVRVDMVHSVQSHALSHCLSLCVSMYSPMSDHKHVSDHHSLYLLHHSVHRDEAMIMPCIPCSDAPPRNDTEFEDEEILILPEIQFSIFWLTVPLALYTLWPRPAFGSRVYSLLTVLWMVSTAHSDDFTFYRCQFNTCVAGLGQVKCWGKVS